MNEVAKEKGREPFGPLLYAFSWQMLLFSCKQSLAQQLQAMEG